MVMRNGRPMTACGCPASQDGFTLIELMVTLTVLAVLMGVGVPSFNNFVAGQKVKTASYDLTAALVMARSEAVKRNTDVTVAPVTANTWDSGWTVKAGATTIQQQQALTGATVTKAASAAAVPASFVYAASGRLTAGATQYLQINGSSVVKCLKVDLTGIPSTQSVACP